MLRGGSVRRRFSPVSTDSRNKPTGSLGDDLSRAARYWPSATRRGNENRLRIFRQRAARHDDFSPAWSPHGRSIAFLRRLPGDRAAVMLISPLGGPERILAETSDVTPAMWDSSGFRGSPRKE